MWGAKPYLLRLAERLYDGLGALREDEARRDRHRDFILTRQEADGGFAGREPGSDLYYTSFAVRGLWALGALDEAACERIAGYLRTPDPERMRIVDLLSWLSTAVSLQVVGGVDITGGADEKWTERIAARLESVRTTDGGYAKSTEGASGSTYHSFLVALAYELIGRGLPEPERFRSFLEARQRDDGGFVEIAPMKRSGTNPTAAAVAALSMFGTIDDPLREDVRAFLLDVRSGEGGFQANTRIPFADGLSTFTALLTAQDLGLDDVCSAAKVERFITGELEFPTGGFRGAAWDNAADVEYTFYGLGVLALVGKSD